MNIDSGRGRLSHDAAREQLRCRHRPTRICVLIRRQMLISRKREPSTLDLHSSGLPIQSNHRRDSHVSQLGLLAPAGINEHDDDRPNHDRRHRHRHHNAPNTHHLPSPQV